MSDYIERDKAIDAVKGRFSMPVDNLIAEVIGELPSADVQPAQPAPQWIPVSERLPDMDGLYLVTVHIWENARKIIGVATSATHWSDGDWRMFDADDVVAWMPLPEPYREGETK